MRLYTGILSLFLIALLKAQAGDAPTRWPHLRELDVFAEHAETFVEQKDPTRLRGLLPAIIQKARQVADDPLPADAPQAKQAKALQQDLRELATSLSASGLNDQQIMELAEGLHPIVEKMMETAGLPHVHDDEVADEDHDQHGHDLEHPHEAAIHQTEQP